MDYSKFPQYEINQFVDYINKNTNLNLDAKIYGNTINLIERIYPPQDWKNFPLEIMREVCEYASDYNALTQGKGFYSLKRYSNYLNIGTDCYNDYKNIEQFIYAYRDIIPKAEIEKLPMPIKNNLDIYFEDNFVFDDEFEIFVSPYTSEQEDNLDLVSYDDLTESMKKYSTEILQLAFEIYDVELPEEILYFKLSSSEIELLPLELKNKVLEVKQDKSSYVDYITDDVLLKNLQF